MIVRVELQHVDVGHEWVFAALSQSITPSPDDGRRLEIDCFIVRKEMSMKAFITYPARLRMMDDGGEEFMTCDVDVLQASEIMPVDDHRRARLIVRLGRQE